jgi:microcystin-dependent protein
MAATQTPNYGWTQPNVGGDATVWGTELNNDLALIDAQVYANEQATVLIGSVIMYAGATAPANWLICDGRSLATTGTYAKLFNIIGYAFGGSGANFNLPNLGAQFPIGVGTNVQGRVTGLGEATGSFSVAIGVANLPPHAHPIVDIAHNHGVNQWAHSHVVATGNHSHAVTTGNHSHSLSAQVLTPNGGASAAAGSGWAFTNINTNVVGNLGGNTDTAGNLGGYTDTLTSSVSLNASGTGLSTTQNTGSGAAFDVIPPLVCLNFIIRYQ